MIVNSAKKTISTLLYVLFVSMHEQKDSENYILSLHQMYRRSEILIEILN